MAKRSSTKKLALSFLLAIVLCVSLAFVGTYALLADSRTATGTVTFNLADYKLYSQLDGSSSITKVMPGTTGKTQKVALINSYTTTTGGTNAGMGAVYLKLTNITIKLGSTTVTPLATFTNENGDVKISTNNGMTITLEGEAGTCGDGNSPRYWVGDGSVIYLSSSNGSLTKNSLKFSESSTTVANGASVVFNVEVPAPSATNGFNATGNSTSFGNNSQGQTLTISYTASWATTIAELG